MEALTKDQSHGLTNFCTQWAQQRFRSQAQKNKLQSNSLCPNSLVMDSQGSRHAWLWQNHGDQQFRVVLVCGSVVVCVCVCVCWEREREREREVSRFILLILEESRFLNSRDPSGWIFWKCHISHSHINRFDVKLVSRFKKATFRYKV